MSPSRNKCTKLLKKARRSAKNFRQTEAIYLAECFGWRFSSQEGSHHVYFNDDLTTEEGRRLEFASHSNEAVPYQVKQLLKAIENLQSKDEEDGQDA